MKERTELLRKLEDCHSDISCMELIFFCKIPGFSGGTKRGTCSVGVVSTTSRSHVCELTY